MLNALVAVLLGASGASSAWQPLAGQDPPAHPRTGTARIAGRVLDPATGLPVTRARVRLEGLEIPPIPVATDDAGAFQFAAVPPCTCAIAVDKSGYAPTRYPDSEPTFRRSAQSLTVGDGTVLDDLVVLLYRGGSISGRVVDAFGDPVESARVQVLRVQTGGSPQPRGGATTDDCGRFRVPRLEPGRYLLFVEHRNQADDPNQLQPVPTFYPGVLDMAQAQPLTLQRGQAVTGVELTLLAAASAWVSGVVLDDNMQPATGRVFVSVRRMGAGAIEFGQFSAEAPGDGTFRAKLPSGEYEIEARRTTAREAGPPAAADERVGILQVSVNGTPLSNLVVPLGAAATITGRVIFDGAEAPLRGTPAEALAASFSALPGDRCRRGDVQNQRDRLAGDGRESDWTFMMTGLSGTCVASMTTRNLGAWFVSAIYYGDLDLLDRPVRFESGQVLRDVRVVLSNRRTQLTVRVIDGHGLPTREYVALVFPLDRSRWRITSRFVRVIVPQPASPSRATGSPAITASSAATDTVSQLPPGAYYAIALDDLGVEAILDPDVLERLVRSATRVSLSAGDTASVVLRRVSPEDLVKR